MKKIPLLFLLILGAAESASPASLSPLTRVLLAREAEKAESRSRTETEEEEYIPVILRLDESAPDPIPGFVHLLSRRGDLAIVNVPAPRVSELLSAPGILRMESGVCALPAMDLARAYCGLDEVRDGSSGLPRSFDGSGVVCGFTDIGFDPAHINFSDPADGSSRVKLLYNYNPSLPLPETASTPAEIAAWQTDNSSEWHATHVAGILAGSYNAPAAPYIGVAPAAEIVGTTSSLNAPYLLAGCDRVIDYAKSQGKPAVINMSISSFTGPRDGSTLFNQYMARVADEAAVCISAGNDGDRSSGYFRFTPSHSRPLVEARVLGSDWSAINVAGVADLWSADSAPFSVQPFIWDDLEKKICLTLPSLDPDAGTDYLEFSSADTPALSSLGDFTARVILTCELNPENKRFNTALGIEYHNNNGEDYPGPYDPAKSRYHIGFRVSAPQNAAIDCHVSSSLMMMSCAGSTAPAFSNLLTINDLCCSPGVISVGAMCTRSSVPVIGSDLLRVVTTSNPGDPASFTSFGDTPLGALPHISAPGAPIISSVSEPYIIAEEIPEDKYSARIEASGRAHHWGEASGTSMSSPFTAGVFALWLQADPSLTPADLLRVARETASSPSSVSDPGSSLSSPSPSLIGSNSCSVRPPEGGCSPSVPADPRWGAGIIDPLAGLCAILSASSLSSVTAEPPAAEFRLLGTTLLCTPLRAPLLSLSAYAPDGRLLASASKSSKISLPLPSSSPVIIAVALLSDGSRHSARFLLPAP